MATFHEEVNSVLLEKSYSKHSFPLDEFTGIVEKNEKLIENKVLFYKWTGMSLLILIALLGVITPYVVALGTESFGGHQELIVAIAGLTLAVATILNSMFKPYERFSTACHIGIKISKFKVSFLLALEKQKNLNDKNLLNLVNTALDKFEEYQEDLIELFMPSQTSNINNSPDSYTAIGKTSSK